MLDLNRLHVAPLWKRSLASSLDDLLPLALLVLARRRYKKMPWILARLMIGVNEVAQPTMFGRTVGQRAFNIRVVSHETGRSPTLKQSLVLWAVENLPVIVLLRWPKSPQLKHLMATTKAFTVEIEELEQKHRDDPEAKNRAIGALIEQRKLLRTLLPYLLRFGLALAYVHMLSVSRRRDPLNQGLAARRAKILLIDERPSSFPRLAALLADGNRFHRLVA